MRIAADKISAGDDLSNRSLVNAGSRRNVDQLAAGPKTTFSANAMK